MTKQDPLLLVFTMVAGGCFSFLVIRGLRQGKVITYSNLSAERNQRPVIYWIFQSYYAVAAVFLPLIGGLASAGYRFGQEGTIDRSLSALSGSFLLFAALLIGTMGVEGLRSGVAIRSSLAFRRPAPTRKKNPIRYWSLELFYLLATAMLTLLGGVMTLVMLK